MRALAPLSSRTDCFQEIRDRFSSPDTLIRWSNNRRISVRVRKFDYFYEVVVLLNMVNLAQKNLKS